MLKNLRDTMTQLKAWTIEQVLWAEKNLQGKSGAEKKAAVIKKIDDLLVLPSYLEWVDGLVISWLIDTVCEKLNMLTEHNFSETQLTEKQEEEMIEAIEIPKEKI